MSGLAEAIITAVTAFVATNIDDLVILLLFFSAVNATFRVRHILIGQYLGFSALVIASLPGFFGGLILPHRWIGLLGLIPIAIGLSSLINREDSLEEVEAETNLSEDSAIASWLSPQVYSVAAITIANGSDNISVYVPLFANSSLVSLILIVSGFFLLVGVWCYLAYKLTNRQAIASILTRYGNAIAPLVLIILGAIIVLESQALTPIKLVASSICLMILVDDRSPEESN